MIGDAGTYIAPKNRYAIPVPIDWTLRDMPEVLQLESPDGRIAITVSLFSRTGPQADMDARQKLAGFLTGQSPVAPPKLGTASRSRAVADYVDVTGKTWRAIVISSGDSMLLVTITASDAGSPHTAVAKTVVDRIKLDPRTGSIKGDVK